MRKEFLHTLFRRSLLKVATHLETMDICILVRPLQQHAKIIHSAGVLMANIDNNAGADALFERHFAVEVLWLED